MLPLACCNALAMVTARLTASLGCGASTSDCPSAFVRPILTWESAEFSALLSSPAAIDWTRKKPSTAMTRMERTSVVETTRS